MTRFEVLSKDKEKLATLLSMIGDHYGEDIKYYMEYLDMTWTKGDDILIKVQQRNDGYFRKDDEE